MKETAIPRALALLALAARGAAPVTNPPASGADRSRPAAARPGGDPRRELAGSLVADGAAEYQSLVEEGRRQNVLIGPWASGRMKDEGRAGV